MKKKDKDFIVWMYKNDFIFIDARYYTQPIFRSDYYGDNNYTLDEVYQLYLNETKR